MPFGLMLILILVPLVIAYVLCHGKKSCPKTRRRWARIKVPTDKRMTCRIIEPEDISSDADYLIDDINMAGIAFFSPKALHKTHPYFDKVPIRKLRRICYRGRKNCVFQGNKKNKYRIGIEYMRER